MKSLTLTVSTQERQGMEEHVNTDTEQIQNVAHSVQRMTQLAQQNTTKKGNCYRLKETQALGG